MKALRYIFFAAVLLLASACQEEIYEPGAPDTLECQGFFFPVQENAGDNMIEAASDVRSLTFTAERQDDYYEAYVPVVITINDDSVFEIPEEIYFDEGQSSTEFTIEFPEAESGKTYNCSISVTDPMYVSSYGLESTELSFSVTIVNWTYLGQGTWRDDMLCWMANAAKPNLETTCDIYEREDMPGYYRLDNVYTAEYLALMINGSLDALSSWQDFAWASSIYIDATDPDKVYMPFSYLGIADSSAGETFILSDVDEAASILGISSNGRYMTLKDGMITAPKGGIIFGFANSAYIYFMNTYGKFRVVLPGYEPVDYSIALSGDEAENGIIPITFSLGPDVSEVKYAIFDGKVSDVELLDALESVKDGSAVGLKSFEGGEETVTLDIKDLEKTGFYTIVACTYDEAGTYKEYASLQFGFDTVDDPKEIKIEAGLIVSDRYAPAGLTAENSMEFYVYGEDITEVKMALYRTANYNDFDTLIRTNVEQYMAPLDKATLNLVNGSGYTGILSGLAAGTEHTLVVYAGNGYHSDIFTFTSSTEGVFNPVESEFTFYDMPSRLQNEDAHDDYLDTWELWSIDLFAEEITGRTFRGDVTISDAEDVVEEDKETGEELRMDILALEGMFPKTEDEYGLRDDIIELEFYEGFVYSLMTDLGSGVRSNERVYLTTAYLYYSSADGVIYADMNNGVMLGGFIDESKDAIAFVSNPAMGGEYLAFTAAWFESKEYTSGSLVDESHAYPLLISKDYQIPEEGVAIESKAAAKCSKVSRDLQNARRNYVETESGYVKSTIDLYRNLPYNYMENLSDVKVVSSPRGAEFSVEVSEARTGITPGHFILDGKNAVSKQLR